MPKRTKAPAATDSLRLGTPMPIKVQEDEEFRPLAVSLLGKLLPVESIEERWEDEEFWWRDNPLIRVTYQVTLEDGRQLTIFKNMLHGGWYRVSG